MHPEYRFDYSKAQGNIRFAPRMRKKIGAVVLDPDVAEVFDTADSVNRLLRSVISAVPKRRIARSSRKRQRLI